MWYRRCGHRGNNDRLPVGQAGQVGRRAGRCAIGGARPSVTTAHLSNALDDRYFEIERLHGAEGAKLAASSHTRRSTA